MKVTFLKYHGLGNDFVILHRPPVSLTPERVVRLCDRHRGIGADGVLVLSGSARAAARMDVFNADGSTAEMCGNGIRCAAKFLVDHAGVSEHLAIDTAVGVLRCEASRGGDGRVAEVAVEIGRPELSPARIPLLAEGDRFVRGRLDLEGSAVVGTAVALGNPHFVVFDAGGAALEEIGPRLERHPAFPQRTNVEFARAEGDALGVEVWERGVGRTNACGTGACAAAVAAVLEGRAESGRAIEVRLPGGVLSVTVAPDLSQVGLRGPAAEVFRGEIDLG